MPSAKLKFTAALPGGWATSFATVQRNSLCFGDLSKEEKNEITTVIS